MSLRGPPQPAPPAPTVSALLARAAAHPSGVTFVDLRERETRYAWAQVLARARRAAAELARRGVRPGDRVAIVLRTEPAFLDAFFGALLAGAVPVPLYPPVRLGRMEEYLASTARMLRVGERTGQMGEMMERIATFHEEELARWVERFTRTFEPLLMAVIGIVIGGIVVLMYFPIFELAGSIQ